MPSPDPSNDHNPAKSCRFPAASALILLGRGGPGPAAREEMTALRSAVQARLPTVQVDIAFVDRDTPSLPETLSRCAGLTQILIQPVFIPGDHALLRWLKKVARRWRHQHASATSPQIRFAPALAQASALPALLVDHVVGHLDSADIGSETGDNWARDPHAWSIVPPHQRHLLFCLGPRCTALGAAKLWQHLGKRLRGNGARQKSVMSLQTSCQYPCNLGPLLIVYPEGVWYGKLDQDAIDRILDQHLETGAVVEEFCVHRLHGE